MANHFFYGMLIGWKRFFTSFRFITQQATSNPKSKSQTLKELKEAKKESKRQFIYVNKNVCSISPDQDTQSQNCDTQNKYHLLSPQ